MKKEEVLDRVEPLFWERPFSEVSMDDLARHLEIKKASLYYYYPSKEGLFLDLVRHSSDTYRAFVLRSFQSEPLPKFIELSISYPIETKNLFSIVFQRGYCRIGAIRDFVSTIRKDIHSELSALATEKYGWPPVRTRAFFLMVDALSKEYCQGESCTDVQKSEMFTELLALFPSTK